MSCRKICDKWKGLSVVWDYDYVDYKMVTAKYTGTELAGLFLGGSYEAARRAIITKYRLNMWAARMKELMESNSVYAVHNERKILEWR